MGLNHILNLKILKLVHVMWDTFIQTLLKDNKSTGFQEE